MPISLTKCPYCGEGRIYSVWPRVNFYRCSRCLLFFRNPMPTQEELDGLYKTAWEEPKKHSSETGGTDEKLASVYARSLAGSLGREDFSGLRILEFGAGKGYMSRALSSLGAEVLAVEPYGWNLLKEQGIKAVPSLSDVYGPFDGVVTIDVWEHLLRPWEVLSRLRELLLPNGWLYVATPNPVSLNAIITRDNWREAKKSGHIFFAGPKTMEEMLRKIGFKNVKRLRWFVRYHKFPRWMLDYLLQALFLDGEVRCLAWN